MAVLRVQTYETIEAGSYPARVSNVTTEEGQFGAQVKVEFELTDDEYEGKTLTGWASAKLSPKSKLYGWASALLFRGRGIPEGYAVLDTDTLKGCECVVVVTVERKPDGSEYNRVKDVLPIRRPGAKPGNGTAPAPAPERVPVGAGEGPQAPEDIPAWLASDGADEIPF